MKISDIKIAAVMLIGVALMASCGKENNAESDNNSENPTENGGISWPERRVSHIESPFNELSYDFTWQDGRVIDILAMSSDFKDTIHYTFSYTEDKITKVYFEIKRYNKKPLVGYYIYEYNGDVINKGYIIPAETEDAEHNSYYTMSYNGGKLAQAELIAWSHNFYTDSTGTTETWEEEHPFTLDFVWNGDNITTISYLIYNQQTEFTGIEYDNHPSPLHMPLGPIEALSLPFEGEVIFGIDYFDDGNILSNMLWNTNNITNIPLMNVGFRYDYDEAGLYPVKMYLVKADGTEQVFMTFSYEN